MCPCHANDGEFVYALLAAAAVLVGVGLMRKHWSRMKLGLRLGGISGLVLLVGLLGWAVGPNRGAATDHAWVSPGDSADAADASGVFAAVGPGAAGDASAAHQAIEGPGVSEVAAMSQTQPEGRVTAYYFHRTVRCHSCLTIEEWSKQVIEDQFRAELAAGVLEYRAVNIDQPENQHFEKDYSLTAQSLVLVRAEDGGQREWKNLEKVWELLDDYGGFGEYVKREVSRFVYGPGSVPQETETAR